MGFALLNPSYVASHHARRVSKLHIEFCHLVRLVPGGLDPFAHMGHRHDGPAISGAHRVELYAICEETKANRCIHGIGKAWLCTEQMRPLGGRKAVAGVAATPGADFDPMHGRRFIRLCYAGATADVGEAVERLGAWLKQG